MEHDPTGMDSIHSQTAWYGCLLGRDTMYLVPVEQTRLQGEPCHHLQRWSFKDPKAQRGKRHNLESFQRHSPYKPGDVIVYNWKNRKHLLIDVEVTSPLAVTNHPHLLAHGPGNTAKHWEGKKRNKYWDLDKTSYEFWLLIVETTRTFGPSALKL